MMLRTSYAWLALALLLGALCRFWNLVNGSLFIDEGFTFHIAEQSPRALLLAVAYTDFHPPFFYLALHYLMAWLHWPLTHYRYFTAACGLATIAAAWSIARRRFGDTTAAVTGFAVALAPALVQSDRLCRMYATLVALTAVSWWLLTWLEDAPREKTRFAWLGYGVAAVMLPYLQYLGAIVVLSQALYAGTRLRRLWPAVGMACVSAFAMLPWLWALKVQYPNGALGAGLRSADLSWPVIVRAVLGYGLSASLVTQAHFDVLFAAGALALCAAGVYAARRSLLPYWLLPIAAQLVASLVSGKDLLVARYLYAYVPAVCMSVAVFATSLLHTRYRIAGVLVCAAWLTVGAIAVPNLLFVPYYQWPDWNGVNALLLRNERDGDLIVLDQGAEYWVVRDFSAFRSHQLGATALAGDIPSSVLWLRGYPSRRVWYIENQVESADSGRRIQAELERTRRRLGSWRQARLYREDIVHIVLYDARRQVPMTVP